MALSLGTTAGTLGFAGAVANIAAWWYNGHPLPVPEDTVAAFAVVAGTVTHATGIVFGYTMNIVNQVLEKKLDITPVNPQQPGQLE